MSPKRRPVSDIVEDFDRVRRESEGTDRLELLQELQVYQEELLVQNQELAAAQHALEETRDRFIDLYEFAPTAYLTLDEHGIVKQINLTGTSLLDRTKPAIEGLPLLGFFKAKERTGFLDFMRRCRVAPAGAPVVAELRLDTANGPRMVELVARWREHGGSKGREYLTAIVDITERRQLERERAMAAREHAALARQLLSVQDDERQRIARDLHDDVGQQITALKLALEAAAARLGSADAPRHIDNARQIAERLDHRLHAIAADLRPASLDLSLAAALRQFVHRWAATFGISAEFNASGLERARLAPEVETHLYRFAQEALNNIAKHASAQNVSVILERRSDGLVLVVEDDGKGFNVEKARNDGQTLGLSGMRERAYLVGGRLEIESKPDMGTSVFLHIPTSTGFMS